MLQAVLDNNGKKFIHTSTSKVYSRAKYISINEKHPLQFQSPCSTNKIRPESIALSFFNSFFFSATIVKPFNIYSRMQLKIAGSDSTNKNVTSTGTNTGISIRNLKKIIGSDATGLITNKQQIIAFMEMECKHDEQSQVCIDYWEDEDLLLYESEYDEFCNPM